MKKLIVPVIACAALLFVAAGARANAIAVCPDVLNPTCSVLPAMEGSFQMEVHYAGPPSLAFVQSRNAGATPHPWNNETAVRVRFLIDPGDASGTAGTGTFDMGAGGNVRIMNEFMDFTPGFGIKVVLFLKKSLADNAWRMAAYVRSGPNGGDGFVFGGEGYLTGLTPAFGTSTIVEIEWEAASAPGANDGRIKATRKQFTNPGGATVTMFERTDLDNDDHTLNLLRLGSVSGAEVGGPIGGHIAIDSVSINRF